MLPFEAADVVEDESPLAENALLDPEQRSTSMTKRLIGSLRDLVAGLKP